MDHRAEHAPPRADRGRRAGRQARVLREARGRHARRRRRAPSSVTRQAGVITGVGYNYRWAPLVRYAKQQLDAPARSAALTNYRGRFFSMYGADPLGAAVLALPRSTRAATGWTSDLLSHAVDLAHFLIGPITAAGRDGRDVHPRAADRASRAPATTAAARRGPARRGDQRGLRRRAVRVRRRRRGTFEASRAIVGPESQMAFDVYGTEGAMGWNLEDLNRLRHYRRTEEPRSGYTTVYGGDRFPYHGAFVPGSGERDRVRGPDRDRGPRVPARGRRGAPVRGRLRAGAATGSAVQAALLKSRRVGPLGGCRVGSGGQWPLPRDTADRRARGRADRAHARGAARAPGAGRGRDRGL